MAKGGIRTLTGSFKGLAGGAASMGRSLVSALPAIGAWIASMWSAAAAHIAAAWPIYAVIGAVAALAGIVYLVVRNWEPIIEWFRQMWAEIVGIFQGAWDSISGIVEGVWDAIAGEGTLLDKLFGTAGAGADEAAGQLGSAVETALDEVTPLMPSSDAERGPLSRLTAAGRAIPTTLAAGIAEEAGAIDAAIRSAADSQLVAPLESAIRPLMPQQQPDAAQTAGLRDARLIEAIESLTAALKSTSTRASQVDVEAAVEMQALIGGVGWEAGVAGA